MCGIAGIKATLDSKKQILSRMMACLAHRGPDSQGQYFHGDIALGHLRLKVIDLTAMADQPMANEDGGIRLIYNGEIYNAGQLRRQLELKGHIFKSKSDAEVIIHSYEEQGVKCLDGLRGMFAFCIWDQKENKLFLARDRLGIKPLYYYNKNGIFIFASEVRAVLTSGIVPKKLSLTGLESYLYYGGLKEPLTIIEDIYSLLPGHYIVLDEDGFKIAKYWDLLDRTVPESYLSQEEIPRKTNLLLKECMGMHLASDVPIGVFLSGGIDSSALVNLAKELTPKLRTISIAFNEADLDEAQYSRLIAKRFNTEHEEFLITDEYVLQNSGACLSAMDEPTFDGLNTYFISQAANKAGLVVVLSGLGGDELFCGYNTFSKVRWLMRLYSLWSKTHPSLKKPVLETFKACAPDTTAIRKVISFLKENHYFRHPYFWTRLLFTPEDVSSILKPPAVTGCAGDNQDNRLEQLDVVNQVSYLEMRNYMVDILLRDTDAMSMAHSLEVRVPFLDHKLVESVLSVPGKFKFKQGIRKPLLINSLDRPLPKTVANRKKMGFVFPLEKWMKGNLKREIEQTIQARDRILEEFINQEAVLDIWTGFLKKRISWQRPWALYVLKKWVKSYLS